MKSIFKLFLLLITVLQVVNSTEIEFTEDEKKWINQHPSITFSTSATNPPHSFIDSDGKVKGIQIDFIDLIAQKTGIQINKKASVWPEPLNNAMEHKVDGIVDSAKRKEREKALSFTDVYLKAPFALVSLEGTKDIKDLNQFCGKKVAVTFGTSISKYLQKNYPCIELVDSYTEQMVEKIVKKEVDAFFERYEVILYQDKNALFSGLKVIYYKFIPPSGFSRLGVRNNDPILFNILNKAINNITFEEKSNITIKWVGSSFPRDENDKNINLTNKETEYLNSKDEITMCINPNMLPFEELDKNGKHQGISADIMKLVSNNLNKPITLIPTNTWNDSIKSLENKKCDFISMMINTSKNKQNISFTTPYINESLVVATQEKEFFIQDSSELKDKTLALVKNSVFIKILKEKYPHIKIVQVNSILEGLKKVQNGQIFAYIDALPSIAYSIQKNALLDLKIAGRLEFDVNFSVATRKNEKLLNSIMNKALKNIEKEQLRTIVGKWISIKVEHSFDYKNLIYISIFFLTILLVILYKNRSIKKINKELEISHREVENKNKLLEELSIKDSLTQLFNRNKLDEVLIEESNKSNTSSHLFGIIIIDIDYFKNINDTHGHLAGDKVLKEFAKLLESNLEKQDTVGRWGGEEFLIICSQITMNKLLKKAEKLRKTIDSNSFSLEDQLTASFGTSIYKKDENIDELIKRADDALYEAKSNGRNRIEFL